MDYSRLTRLEIRYLDQAHIKFSNIIYNLNINNI